MASRRKIDVTRVGQHLVAAEAAIDRLQRVYADLEMVVVEVLYRVQPPRMRLRTRIRYAWSVVRHGIEAIPADTERLEELTGAALREMVVARAEVQAVKVAIEGGLPIPDANVTADPE